jgi:cell division protein FtsL
MTQLNSRNGVSVGRVLLHLLPPVLLAALFVAVGILHVAGRVMVVDMGYRFSKAETESRTLTRENDRLKLELATLKAPARLERLAREQLGMMMPSGSAVVSLQPELPGVRRNGKAEARTPARLRVAERESAP